MFDPDCFEYHDHFLGRREADCIKERLWQELDWAQKEITIFGRRMMQPRLIAWYGDPLAEYSYSGILLKPTPWHPILLQLKIRLASFTGCSFNSVLANAYRHGADSMGWHSDNEPELGEQPVIASVSLGAARRFLVRPQVRTGGRSSASVALTPEHGSLLLMKADCQEKYQHAVPKTKKAIGFPINLTYREILPQSPV